MVTLNPGDIERLLEAATSEVSEGGSPLRKFRGRVVAIEGVQKQSTNSKSGVFFVLTYKFDQLQVIESKVPYAFGTAQLSWNANDLNAPSASSPYGVLVASQGRILGNEARRTAVKGKVVEIHMTSGHMGRKQNQTTQVWEDVPFDAYEFIEIDGKRAAGAVANPNGTAPIATPPVTQDIDVVIAQLADGKDNQQFLMAVYQDARIKSSPAMAELVQSHPIVIRRLQDKKLITVDEKGVMRLVK